MNVAVSRDTFQRCFRVASELEGTGHVDDAIALLRSLQVYLDILPAFPDGSCKNTVKGRLGRLSGQSFQQKREKTA